MTVIRDIPGVSGYAGAAEAEGGGGSDRLPGARPEPAEVVAYARIAIDPEGRRRGADGDTDPGADIVASSTPLVMFWRLGRLPRP